MSDLNIADALLEIQDGEFEIEYDIHVSTLSANEIHDHLNDVVDKLEDSSYNITDQRLFDKLRCFIKEFSQLRPHVCNQVVDVLLTGMNTQIDAAHRESQEQPTGSLGPHRSAFERYAFLLQWLASMAEARESARNAEEATAAVGANATRIKRGRGSRKKSALSKDNDDHWDWTGQRVRLLETLRRCIRLRLGRVWETGPELDTFINLVTKPAYLLLENAALLKQVNLRNAIYSLIGNCIKYHNHAFAAQTTIMQNLQYYEHLSQPMADLLSTVVDQFDYSQIADSVLCEISNKEFSAQDASGPRNFSKFLSRLAEIAPKLVLKQMVHLSKHLDSESYAMRMAVIEAIGNIMVYLLSQEPDDTINKQIEAFFDIVEERFRDVNSFCRCKVLQLCSKLCDCKAKFPKRRQRLVEYTISRLEDKSSHVRANAIKALTKFIETHPFIMDGGELALSKFEEKHAEINRQLQSLNLPQGMVQPDQAAEITGDNYTLDADGDVTRMEANGDNGAMNAASNGSGNSMPGLDPETAKEYIRLQLQQRYYSDAIQFARQIDDAIPVLCQLLASTNKTEVIDAMEFFVTAHYYRIQAAQEGIRKMVHLVWSKDSGSDESKGIRGRLIDCYRSLYLAPIPSLSAKDNVSLATRKLISLTFNTTLAELTSLEQLLATMMAEDLIPYDVVRKLWTVYSYNKPNMPVLQRRGAIIILGMLASAKKEVVADHIDLLLRIGLGQFGRDDLTLAKYTCIALQRLLTGRRKGKGSLDKKQARFPKDHAIFRRLKELIEMPCTSQEWFSVAEQALNAIYMLSEHPDEICTDILRNKTVAVFNLRSGDKSTGESTNDEGAAMQTDAPPSGDDMAEGTQLFEEQCITSPYELSQLVFLAGHIGVKQIVHLELVEVELKRRKNEENDKKKQQHDQEKKDGGAADDELDQVAGTAEDDVAEAVARVRERELMYSRQALLTLYGPMAAYICANNKTFDNVTLQTTTTMALTKFMCVSAEYCERHLPLLLTILEKSREPTIRSNIIIALGDIAVCFNSLIEQNIVFLYKRLQDSDLSVKKNALMVLTHLILNGMVKVKGQLGEMAKCIEDPDQRISDLAKLFFTELASKDNAVYNNLPDVISHLSVGENAVDEATFIRIMKFLFEFIKDKHADNIVDKLCLRFKNTDDPRQWRDAGFCLSQLPYRTERSLKKLLDAMPLYEDKLHDDVLYKYFSDIVQKARLQKIQRAEVKLMVDDLERRIQEHHEASGNQQEAVVKATAAKTKVSQARKNVGRGRGGKSASATPATATAAPAMPTPIPSTPTRNRRKSKKRSDDEDEDDEDDTQTEEVTYEIQVTPRRPVSQRGGLRKSYREASESEESEASEEVEGDDDDDDDDDVMEDESEEE